MRDAVATVRGDRKILTVGAMQALFEGAMYIFVLQWPPALAKGVAKVFGQGAATPFGAVFSCFMVCCLLGSTRFQALAARGVRTGHRRGDHGPRRRGHGRRRGLGEAERDGEPLRGLLRLRAVRRALLPDDRHAALQVRARGPARDHHEPAVPSRVLVVGCFLSIKKLKRAERAVGRGGRPARAAAAAAADQTHFDDEGARTRPDRRWVGALIVDHARPCFLAECPRHAPPRRRRSLPPRSAGFSLTDHRRGGDRKDGHSSAHGERGCAGPCR